MPKQKPTVPPLDLRTFLTAADPVQIFEAMQDGQPMVDDPMRALYRRLRAEFLEREGGQAAVDFAEIVSRADDSSAYETAIQLAGFVMGFEYCRRLLLGETRGAQ